MQKEKVGMVTEREKKEILRLYERKNALKELYVTLSSPYLTEEEKKALYERIIEDMQETSSQYNEWWREMPKKYRWKSMENGRWTINFETNEIYLDVKEGNPCREEACND